MNGDTSKRRGRTGDRASAASATTIRILGISGSLRARSSNTEVLHALSLLAPADVQIELLAGLDALPHFNPDLDAEGALPPPPVGVLRQRIEGADALLISSPEYAHGVPGALKNALDWLVSSAGVIGKPVGLLNAAPRASHAQASLAETLRTMSMTVVPAASIAVPVSGRELTAAAIARDPELSPRLRGAIDAIVRAATECRGRGPTGTPCAHAADRGRSRSAHG